MAETHEDIFKLMTRVEGYARTLQQMAQNNTAISEIEQQIKIVEGIVRKAKLATLRADVEAGKLKNPNDLMKRIDKLLR